MFIPGRQDRKAVWTDPEAPWPLLVEHVSRTASDVISRRHGSDISEP